MCSRGEGRVAAAAHREARPGGLAAADERLRQALEGAGLRRRHGLDHADGDPLEGAAPEDARAEPRADHRRLPPADDLRRVGREPRPGGLADLAVAEGARARPRRPDHRDLAALAGGRAAARQAADPLRPARERLASSRTPTSCMFIYRDEYYNGEESDQQGLAEVHLAKHRNGPTDMVKLSFLRRFAKFADLAPA